MAFLLRFINVSVCAVSPLWRGYALHLVYSLWRLVSLGDMKCSAIKIRFVCRHFWPSGQGCARKRGEGRVSVQKYVLIRINTYAY